MNVQVRTPAAAVADACERPGSTWQARGQGFESPKLHTYFRRSGAMRAL